MVDSLSKSGPPVKLFHNLRYTLHGVTMAHFKLPVWSLSPKGNLAENWKTWLQRYELFCVASGVADKSQAVQCATFLHEAGEEAMKVNNTFVFGEEERNKMDVLQRKFKDYCEPRKKMPDRRDMFLTRAQSPSTPIDAYVTDLKNKAKDCKFGNLFDSQVPDRIVCGIRDDQMKARLLRKTAQIRDLIFAVPVK